MLDKALASKLIKGDLDTFEYIVNSYERSIYGFIYHMTNDSHVSEDLTQDVFLKVHQNIYKYNTDYPFEPWIYKIAYNTTLNYLKKNKFKEVPISETLAEDIQVNDSADSFITRNIIEQEIKKLKPENKAIFIFRIFQDMTFEQIANLLNTSTATVKLRFYRDREEIIERLKKTLLEV